MMAAAMVASCYLCPPFSRPTASLSLLTCRSTVQLVQVQLSMRSSRWNSMSAVRMSLT
jgi:hypothetical protein